MYSEPTGCIKNQSGGWAVVGTFVAWSCENCTSSRSRCTGSDSLVWNAAAWQPMFENVRSLMSVLYDMAAFSHRSSWNQALQLPFCES
jgi:hypothetical protein